MQNKSYSFFNKITSPHRLILIALFSIFFLPQAFILLDDINLIIAYETDPGSIINSIEDLFKFPFYSMFTGYHSKFYGWTYISINFFALLPVKLFLFLIGSDSKFLIYSTIRLVFFAIGLASALALFEVAERLFKNHFVALIISVLYIFSPNSNFFYFIHPETTGILFTLLGIVCLLDFIEKQDSKFYFFGLACLVLASLSKQVFFFISLPILFSFFHFYCISHKKKYAEFFLSKKFRKIFLYTILISLLTLFIVHPYAFFRPSTFIKYQTELFHSFSNDTSPSFQESLLAWIAAIKNTPVIALSIILIPIQLFFILFVYFKQNKKLAFLYATSLFTVAFFVLLVANSNRMMFSPSYLYPIYPICLLNIAASLFFLAKNKYSCIRITSCVLAAYLTILIVFCGIRDTSAALYSRMLYKDNITYQTYTYIKQNLTMSDKIAYDHFVALPYAMNSIGCHYWQGCGSDYIEEFKPNYVMFNESFTYAGKPHIPTTRLKKYVLDHHFKLLETLKNQGNEISVYKK